MAMTLLAYLPSLNGPQLWDDREWFGAMEWNLRGWRGLWRLWTVPESLQQYYPVTAMSFWIDHHLWGRWMLPAHLQNVLWHSASAMLFWVLLKRLSLRGAWLAAAIFAVHPVMVESVAWITERKNVLCTFFALLALLFHGAGAGWWASSWGKRTKMAGALALVCFVLALLSKISAAVLPGVVLVIGWWRCDRVRWRADGLRVLPWVAVSMPLVWLTSSLEQAQVEGGDWLPVLAWDERLLLAGQLPWFYLGKLLWPAPLCVIYEKWALAEWQWAGAVLLVTGMAFLAWKRWRGALALVLLFLGTLLPVLGFFEVNGMKYAWAADRWAYLPAMAACAGAGIGMARLHCSLGVALLFICGALTWRQAGLYHDADTFWQAAIAGNPAPWKAHNDYGSHLLDEKRPEDARAQFEAALQCYPEFVSAMVNLGSALKELGQHSEAIKYLDRAIALHPTKNSAVHFNKALVLEEMNQHDAAEASLRAAIAGKPDFYAAYNELGNLLLLAGKHEEAMRCYRTLLELRPGDAVALTSIGTLHLIQGETGRALGFFIKALEDDPNMTGALANAAWILATTADDQLRDGEAALRHAQRAAELSKHADPSILQVLAVAFASVNDFAQAAATAAEAASLARTRGDASLAESIEVIQRQFELKEPYRSSQ
jgi:protein O-mannosyl-transferase